MYYYLCSWADLCLVHLYGGNTVWRRAAARLGPVPCRFSDVMLAAWSQPWWKYVHHRNPKSCKPGLDLFCLLLVYKASTILFYLPENWVSENELAIGFHFSDLKIHSLKSCVLYFPSSGLCACLSTSTLINPLVVLTSVWLVDWLCSLSKVQLK